MGSSRRTRRIVIGVIIVVVVVLAVLVIKGIVERRREAARDRIDDALARTTGGSQQSTGAASGSSQGGSGSASGDSSNSGQTGQLAPPLAPPDSGGSDSLVPIEDSPNFLEIVDQNVTPFRTTPGHDMAFMAKISGNAVSVTMSIADTAGAGGAFTVNLTAGPTTNGVTTWSYDGQAPAITGTYSYATTAVASDGHTVQQSGATVIVE